MNIYKYSSIESMLKILENGFIVRNLKEFNDYFEMVDIDNPEKYNVVCFSKSSSALMWAHYGDSHKGCRILLDKSKYGNVDFKKIEYCNRAKRKEKNDDEKIFIKGSKWEYEKEVRVVYNGNKKDSYFKKKGGKIFFSLYTKCICLGCKIDENEKLSESGKNKLKNIENYLNFLKKIKAINDEATANKKKTTDYIKIIESRLDDKEYTIYNGEELDYETKIKELEEKIEKFNEINKT